jgi:hypothetical protein
VAARSLLAFAGVLVLGIVLLAVGAFIEPARPQVSETGESLIALGLTFVIAGIGYLLAAANPNS